MNIWRTPEAEAWCRDFDYENYVLLHKKSNCLAAPFPEKIYDMLCGVFETHMIDDMKMLENATSN